MKKTILILAFILLLTGCGEISSENNSADDTANSAQTAVSETSEKITESEIKISETMPENPEPLPEPPKDPYYNSDDFSMIIQINDLKSSLYYPDIVNDYGANDELFVLESWVKVKNTALESRDFDIGKLNIGDDKLFPCDDPEEFKNIGSGDTVRKNVRFLGSLEQIGSAENIYFGNEKFDLKKELLSDEIREIIKVQSSEDIKEYLYRKNVIHSYGNWFHVFYAQPCAYDIEPEIIEADGKKYLKANVEAYNRSDYAQLIEPRGFRFRAIDGNDANAESVELVPQFISADDKLMYQPPKLDKIKGINSKIYEVPDFLCMNESGATKFTLYYDADNFNEIFLFEFVSEHENSPCYNKIDEIIGIEIDY